MSTVEKKSVLVHLIDIGTYKAELPRINAPLSIQHLMKHLPLKGRALKQGSRLVLPTDLKVRPEKPRNDFTSGDISIDPSSANLSIHLRDSSVTPSPENYLGSLTDPLDSHKLSFSCSLIIKELE